MIEQEGRSLDELKTRAIDAIKKYAPGKVSNRALERIKYATAPDMLIAGIAATRKRLDHLYADEVLCGVLDGLSGDALELQQLEGVNIQEARRQDFEALKAQLQHVLDVSGVSLDAEVLESIQFSRTYTQFLAGLSMLKKPATPYWLVWEEVSAISSEAQVRLRDMEAEFLGVDLSLIQ